jgi:hypothetical protein
MLNAGKKHSINYELTTAQKEIMDRIARSFENGIEVQTNRKSDLCSENEFVEYFSNLFCVYHSITEHKFEKKSFEFAFKYASIAAGHTAHVNTNSSFQGADIIRDRQNFSLKTEGENNLHTLKISKFSEARFIAKYKTENEESIIKESSTTKEEKRRKLKELEERRKTVLLPKLAADIKGVFSHHLSSYERIISLKTNKELDRNGDTTGYYYRLIEIPIDKLKKAENITAESFTPLRGSGTTTAKILNDDGTTFCGLTIDGSVEKLTITGIKIAECFVHASFKVPVNLT